MGRSPASLGAAQEPAVAPEEVAPRPMPESPDDVLRWLGVTPELRFDDVYDNQMPSLRRIRLTNAGEEPVSVELPLPRPGLRWVQPRAGAANGEPWAVDVATNTAAWVHAGGLEPAQLRSLRHKAANMDVCERVALAPREAADVFLEVRVRELSPPSPRPQGPTRDDHAPHERSTTMLLASMHVATPARRVTASVPVLVSACEPVVSVECVEAQNTSVGRDYQLMLDLGDVVVGEHVARDVQVTNHSAIECFVHVKSHDDGTEGPVAVMDPQLGRRIDGELLALAPFEARTMRLVLAPQVSHANLEQTFVWENAHRPSNTTRILVRANLLGAASDDALQVLSESPLDFGDCCGGQWTRQLLVLKNQSDAFLDVVFRTEPGVEVTFQLAELASQRDSADEGEAPDDDVPLGGTSSSTRVWSGEVSEEAGSGSGSGMGRSSASAAPEADDDAASDVSSNASQAGSEVDSAAQRTDSLSRASEAETHDAPPSSAASSTMPSGSVPSIAPSTHLSGPSVGQRIPSYSVSALATSQPRQRRLHDPMAMLRGGGESQHNEMEELVLRPGAQYRIVVSYRPPREPADEAFTAGRLRHTSFRLFLDYVRASDHARTHHGRQRREIVCHTRTCTPFISVAPRVVDFGLADVGARKTAQVAVTNHSELETRVLLRFVSKVLSMYMDEIAVPARQTVELKMDFFPRRVNDSYRKQITVMNLLNRENDQILEVRARNVDLQRVSFHSLFYRILTPSGSNYIDFGDVHIHAPSVRSFGIENLCATRLSLEMSVAHPEDLQLYMVPPQQPARPTDAPPAPRRAAWKERFLESISTDAPAGALASPARTNVNKQRNHAQALRRGSRGRATVRAGAAMTYKDASLLQGLQYLDLASGLPGTRRSLRAPKGRVAQPPPEVVPSTPPRSLASPSPPSALALPAASDVPSPGRARGGAAPSSSPALTGTWRRMAPLVEPQDVAALDTESLVRAWESQPSSLSAFLVRNVEAEEKLVRTEIHLQRALREAISRGQLVPIGLLDVAPHAVMQVVAVYTPRGSTRPHIQGTARKQDSRIFLRLLQFDRRRAVGVPEFEVLRDRDIDELPVRDLMVRASVCRSMLELGQPHINFGHMDKGDRRERKIWIQNRSEWALRYCIRKSGSIASGDIRLGRGRYGIVPGYGKRGVDFTFSPSLSGPFCERLVVENVADHDNDQAIVLKANVRKVPNFAVEPATLQLGACRAAPGAPESVRVSNTTPKPRTLVVQVDEAAVHALGVPVRVLVAASDDTATRRTLTTEEEEEVETLYQKVKIASRKGNVDKLAKYRERLTQLGVAVPEAAAPVDAAGAATEEPAAPQDDLARYTCVLRDGRPADALTLTIAAHRSQKLLVRVCAPAGAARDTDVQVPLQLHEAKNSDETRHVVLYARVEVSSPDTQST
ncbi:hypothetical protein MCAP1_002883 [Malassezia caprae]|uniref:Uncharacterized protein n=1 Tax=Malassezia caprae TaxID=1381934 RepID=A0AAF0IWB3_9BASI|nr:hypothetical protein MCAP1_002883 [Malassezia caprae]